MRRPSSFTSMPLSTTGAQIIGPNPQRHALMISAPYTAGAQSSFAPRSIGVVGDGFTLQAGESPLYLSLDSHGRIVQDAWWGWSAAARIPFASWK